MNSIKTYLHVDVNKHRILTGYHVFTHFLWNELVSMQNTGKLTKDLAYLEKDLYRVIQNLERPMSKPHWWIPVPSRLKDFVVRRFYVLHRQRVMYKGEAVHNPHYPVLPSLEF